MTDAIKACFFDLDGVLVHTQTMHDAALQRAMWDYGYLDFVGVAGERSISQITNHLFLHDHDFDRTEPDRIYAHKWRHYTQIVALWSGVDRTFDPSPAFLTSVARDHFGHVAIVTDTPVEPAGWTVSGLGLAIPEHVMALHARQNHMDPEKPDPHLYRLALEYAEVNGDEALAVEDSDRGVEAAQAAGITHIVQCADRTGALTGLIHHAKELA